MISITFNAYTDPSGGYSETKIDKMIAILTELQKYVPQQQSSDSMPKFHSLAFGGDQLTVRNARKAQRTRVTSENQVESLEGFVPFSCDWHAECNVLQVSYQKWPFYYKLNFHYFHNR